MTTVTMQAPDPSYTKITTRTGHTYYSDANGLTASVLAEDQLDLMAGGWTTVAPGFTNVRVALSDGKNADGSALAAAASSGKFGQTITLGTVSGLISEVANNNTKTDTVVFEVDLPDSFPGASSPDIIVNANHVIGGGTLTTHTIAAHAYKINDDGSQSADLVTTTAIATPAAAGDMTFHTSSLALVAGGRMMISLVLTLTETATSATHANINSVRLAPAA